MEASAAAIRDVADSPTLHGVDTVRTQLEQVEAHIAETFQHLDERDRLLSDTILGQVKEHGDLISRETARIVESMQGYVQGGTEAMGYLAQRVEAHAEAFAVQDIQIAEDVRAAVAAEAAPLQERLEMIDEHVGLHGRATDDVRVRVEHLIEARMRGLAELIRSDSMALRRLIEERGAGGAVVAGEIDAEAVAEVVGQQVAMRLTSGELRLEDQLEKMMDAQLVRIGEQLEARLNDHLEARFAQMAEVVAQRAAEAADVAIASSFGSSLERMNVNVGAMEGIDSMIAETQAAAEDRLMGHIDDRMTAIARLIRSDNQALADRLAAQPVVVPEPAESRPAAGPRAPARDAPHDEGAAGRPARRDGHLHRHALPRRLRPAARRDPVHRRGHDQGGRGARPEDRSAQRPRGRGLRERAPGGRGPHERGHPRDVDDRALGAVRAGGLTRRGVVPRVGYRP